MKKLISLLVLLALAFIAYTAYWFTAANRAEEHFVKALATWRQEHDKDAEIGYESISKEGFPTHVTLSLNKPHFTTLPSEEQPWRLHSTIDGSLKLSGSVLGKEHSATIDGTQHAELSTPDDPHTIYVQWQGHMEVSETTESGASHFEQLKNLMDESAKASTINYQWPERLTLHADLQNANVQVKNQNQEVFSLKAGPSKIDIAKKGDANSLQEITYAFDMHDLEGNYPRGDLPENTIAEAYVKFLSFDPQVYGKKVDFKTDGTVCFPSAKEWNAITENPWAPRQTRFCLNIDNLDLKSALGHHAMRGFVLDLQQKQGEYTFTHRSKSEGDFTPAYDAMLTEKVANFLKSPGFLKDAISEDPQEQQRFVTHIPELLTFLPRLHTWGNITSQADLTAKANLEYNKQGENGEEVGLKDIHFDLKDFNYKILPYALQLTSDFDSTDYMTKNTGKATLFLSHYKQLVQHIMNYNNHLSGVLKKMNIASIPQLPFFQPEHIDHVLGFLESISDGNKDAEDLNIKATYQDEQGWKVGKMDSQEVYTKGSELVTHLQTAF